MSGYSLFGFANSSSRKTSSISGGIGKLVHDSEDHNMTIDDVYHFFDVIQEYDDSYVCNTLKQILTKQQDHERYNIRLGENNIAPVLVLSLQYFYLKEHRESIVLLLVSVMKYMCRYDGKSRETCIEENLRYLQHAGACDLLPRVLDAYINTDELEILERACEVIGALAVTEEIQSSFGESGACDSLLRLLSHFAKNSFVTPASSSSAIKVTTVIEKACAAMWNLSINDKNEKILGEKGGCELMLQILNHFLEDSNQDENIVEKVCAVIWNLSVLDSNEEKLNKAGACVTLMKVCQLYLTTNFSIIEKVCGAIHNIAQNEEHQEKLGNLGMSVLLVKAMREYFPITGSDTEERETMMLKACGAIWHLSENEHNIEKLGTSGACEVVATVLHHYFSINEQIVQMACGSIRNLAITPINIVRITSSHGVLEDLEKAMTVYGDVNLEIYSFARDALDRLQLLKYNNNNHSSTHSYDENDGDYLDPW